MGSKEPIKLLCHFESDLVHDFWLIQPKINLVQLKPGQYTIMSEHGLEAERSVGLSAQKRRNFQLIVIERRINGRLQRMHVSLGLCGCLRPLHLRFLLGGF